VFLFPNLHAENAQERLSSIAETVDTVSRSIFPDCVVSASLGASFYPTDGGTAEELLAVADRRMYLDKQLHYDALGGTDLRLVGKVVAA